MLEFEDLPDDCLLVLLGFLSPSQLHEMRLINKRFFSLTQRDRLWKGIYYAAFPEQIAEKPVSPNCGKESDGSSPLLLGSRTAIGNHKILASAESDSEAEGDNTERSSKVSKGSHIYVLNRLYNEI